LPHCSEAKGTGKPDGKLPNVSNKKVTTQITGSVTACYTYSLRLLTLNWL